MDAILLIRNHSLKCVFFVVLSVVSCKMGPDEYFNKEEQKVLKEISNKYRCFLIADGYYYDLSDERNCWNIEVGFCEGVDSNRGREKDSISQLVYFEILGRIPRIREIANCTQLVVSDCKETAYNSTVCSYSELLRIDNSSLQCLDLLFGQGIYFENVGDSLY